MALIVFCLYGGNPDFANEARMMVGSCKRHGYTIVQLSDEVAPDIPGADEVVRKKMDCPQVLYRYRRLAEIEPPFISLDTDLLVLEPIDGLIDMEYDATMTKRQNNDGMIYNGGVFSVHRRGFIEDCVEQIEGMRPEWQNWTGGQRAMVDAAKRWKLKEVPCDIWNNSPTTMLYVPKDAKVLHFKGKRRSMMPHANEMLCSRR